MTRMAINIINIPKHSGIYVILNVTNGKMYVGSAVNLKERAKDHRTALVNNKHWSKHLQRSWTKHGEGAFEFLIVCSVIHPSNLVKTEQHFIDLLKPVFNSCPTAGSMLGFRHSEETKERIRKTIKSNPEAMANMERAKLLTPFKALPIICNETGQWFPSIKQAALSLSINQGNLHGHISGKRNSVAGLTFRLA